MPLAFRPDARAPGNGANLKRLLGRPLLTRLVSHFGRHGEIKRRITRKVGGWRSNWSERHFEDAVLVRHHFAFVDEVLPVVVIVLAKPAPPFGIARRALNIPLDFCVLDWESRVRERLARHSHRLAKLRLFGRPLELCRKLRTLVFLDIDLLVRLAATAVKKLIPGIDSISARQSIAWRYEGVDERTPLVWLEAHRGDILSIWILKRQVYMHLRLRAEVARMRIGVVGDSLDLDFLPGAV